MYQKIRVSSLVILSFLFYLPSSGVSAQPNNCTVVNENSEGAATSLNEASDRSVCFRLNGLVSNSVNILAASLTNKDSSSATRGYDYEVRLIDGTVIHSSFSDDTGEINDFDLGGETAVTIKLTPKVGTNGRDFNFSVLNGNENNQFSFIYIGGNTSPNQTPTPPTGSECDPKTGICYDPLSSNIETQSDGFDIQDAPTCNDGNPPSK